MSMAEKPKKKPKNGATPPDCAALCRAENDAAVAVAEAGAAFQAAVDAYNAAVAARRAAGCTCTG